jgi:hypothetical protein
LSGKRSVLRTIRLTKTLDQALLKEAEDRSVSFNTLANGILSKYCEWDRFQEKTHRVTMPQIMLETLFRNTSQETLAKATKEMGNRIVEMSLFYFGASDVRSVLRFLEVLGKYSGYLRLEEKIVGNAMVLEFFHRFEMQFSQYWSATVQIALQKAGGPRPEIDVANHVVSVKIPLEFYKPARVEVTDIFAQGENVARAKGGALGDEF